jgi:serine/threonine protein kinase
MTEQLIGNYKILEKIGAGGMARVYLAVHKDVPNLKVILKILTDSRLVERFTQEADKLALLDGNPNICRIKHFFNHGEDIVIAMEYIDGVTLEEKIKKEGRLTIDESLRVIHDVLGVLDFAHAKGVCHRDIKPSNIMIDSGGHVKVIDFGIAKAESDPSLTIAGTACGTPPYMAPEQFTPSQDTNYVLVDIYAVGTTLYHLVSGELPFKGDNEFAIRDAKLFTDPPSLREKVPAISKELDGLVMRSLKKNPIDRFASAAEMIEAVDCIRCKEGVAQPTTTIRTDSGKKKKLPLKGFIAAAIIVAAAFAAYYGIGLFSDGTPAAPNPLSPANGAIIADNTPTLHWQQTGAENYSLEYANNPDFLVPETVTDISDTFYAVTGNLDNGVYYWRVRDVVSGEAGAYSEAFELSIEAPVAKGTVAISVRPSGDIYIDDELIERNSSGTSVELDAGQHRLRLVNERALNKEIRDDLIVSADTSIIVGYTFRFPATSSQPPTQTPPAAGTGELTIGSKPTIGADIYIDDELQERKTPSAFRLEPGLHVIRAVLLVDGAPRERLDSVTVAAGGAQRIMFDFEK